MRLEFQQISVESMLLYASVPISFTVRSQLRITPMESGLGGIRLVEEPVDPPLVKDFDAGEPPMVWPTLFDVRNWAFFIVSSGGSRPVGAAAVAFDTPGVHMLGGAPRPDRAVGYPRAS